MAKKTFHVIPVNNNWAVKAGTAEKPIKVFRQKDDAIDCARELSKKDSSEIFIHDRFGKISKYDNK